MAVTAEDLGAEVKKLMNTPLVQNTDMNDEMRVEAVELVMTGIDKCQGNWESGSKFIKEAMDKKFGGPWHCVIGEGFGFDVTYELKHLLYMFFGTAAVLVFKA